MDGQGHFPCPLPAETTTGGLGGGGFGGGPRCTMHPCKASIEPRMRLVLKLWEKWDRVILGGKKAW